jgi:hypothetical protein
MQSMVDRVDRGSSFSVTEDNVTRMPKAQHNIDEAKLSQDSHSRALAL